MKFSLDKYKFYRKTDKETGAEIVIAASTYGGKTVKGYAKCDPKDTFDEDKGRKLAAVRCGEKIAAKRVMRATKKYLEAAKAADEAMEFYDRMKLYYMDAIDQHDEAVKEIETLMINY